jgi:hypothetical protein
MIAPQLSYPTADHDHCRHAAAAGWLHLRWRLACCREQPAAALQLPWDWLYQSPKGLPSPRRLTNPLIAQKDKLDGDAGRPALFVRTSMSVPVFFYPVTISGLPNDTQAQQHWASLGYTGPVPDKVRCCMGERERRGGRGENGG